jgi:hypothetical protein
LDHFSGTGISYPHSRACPLIGWFFLGFTMTTTVYCDDRENDSYRNIILRCSFIDYIFLSYCVWQQGTCLFLPMIKKRINIKTLGGLRPLVQIRYPRVSMLFLLLIKWDSIVWFTITYNAHFQNKTTNKYSLFFKLVKQSRTCKGLFFFSFIANILTDFNIFPEWLAKWWVFSHCPNFTQKDETESMLSERNCTLKHIRFLNYKCLTKWSESLHALIWLFRLQACDVFTLLVIFFTNPKKKQIKSSHFWYLCEILQDVTFHFVR